MRYFVTQITTVNGATAIATTEKSDIIEAKSLYHQILASSYAYQDQLEYALVYIDNEFGNRELMEVYHKPEEGEVEPVEEEEKPE